MAPISSAVAASPSSPPTTTTSLQDMSAAAAAIALDMKPNVDLMQTQKIKKLVRRNASDKLKLIQMVHDNPILWDSRLPNFKGAEEEKNRAWEHIGKEFNAPGRRVARAFKSLRESYRRELAHVKLMGVGFKPKWSLYDAMDFLRDVIRERKGGAHVNESLALGLNLSAFSQHINNNNNNNNNSNNNNNNHNNNKNHSSNSSSKSSLKLGNGLHSSFNDSALNLSKCSTMNLSNDDYYYFVKPEMDLSNGGSATQQQQQQQQQQHLQLQQQLQQPLPAHQHHYQQQQLKNSHHQLHHNHHHLHHPHNDSRVSSTRNDSTQNTTYDDMDASSLRSGDDVNGDADGDGDGDGDEASVRNTALSHEGSDEIEELDAIDADFPYPLILDSNSQSGVVGGGGNLHKRRRKDIDCSDADGGVGTDDDYDDQMLQQHHHLRQQHNLGGSGNVGGGGGGGGGGGLDMPPPQTVREVLNSKFCGFISAKLNSMEDSEADNLMNRILMLLVQTQRE